MTRILPFVPPKPKVPTTPPKIELPIRGGLTIIVEQPWKQEEDPPKKPA